MDSAVEPVTDRTPRPVRRPVLAQHWRDVCFVHWALPPDAARPFLPRGTRPDVVDGVTYVGLVAFRMVRVGPPGLPVPYLGTFCETNVRLYSVDDAGRRGVVFLSLDAERLLPALTGRAVGLPYQWSAMRLTRAGDRYEYACRRRGPEAAGAYGRIVVRVGAQVDRPTAVERFLTARWGLHAPGRYLPNEHPAWPLRRADLLDLTDELVPAAGLPAPAGPPDSVLWSPGVPARFGLPRR